MKDFPQEEGLNETDHTTDPEWAILDTHMRGLCENKVDVTEWWNARKKELKQRKPHFAKAFFQNNVIPFAAGFEAQQVWDDAPPAEER